MGNTGARTYKYQSMYDGIMNVEEVGETLSTIVADHWPFVVIKPEAVIRRSDMMPLHAASEIIRRGTVVRCGGRTAGEAVLRRGRRL